MRAGSIQLLLTVFLVSIAHVQAHPECLDFSKPRPPILSTEQQGLFCYHYTNSSCCSVERDREILTSYFNILRRSNINHEAVGRCFGMIFHIVCTECDPYAAYIFDIEATRSATPLPLPGLCPRFCRFFFDRCRELIPSLTDDRNLLFMAANPRNGEQFCRALAITETKYCYPDLLWDDVLQKALSASPSTPGGDGGSGEDTCICLKTVASNLRNPLILQSIPDGTGRMIIVEQAGVVYLYSKSWEKYPEPFMDISSQVLLSRWGGDERGFLNLVFHPSYATNGRFFCYFSVRETTGRNAFSTHLREFAVNRTDPNKAEIGSSRLLLKINQPYQNHNGGGLFFGYDGYLYLFTGDGGAAGDPGNRSQNMQLLYGKALRINVDVTPTPTVPYGIPVDNPFVNTRVRPEIFAYGLRNPWRCSLDPGDRSTGLGRGRIFCADVGQSSFEEIDIVQRGGDHGWRRREGFACYNPSTNCENLVPTEVLPIFVYNHTVGQSVIGGYVYRGCANPALNGAYIFGDYVSGRLLKIEEDSSGWRDSPMRTCNADRCQREGLTSSYVPNILSFGEDEEGELYILSSVGAVSGEPTGKVYKIIDPNRRGNTRQCRRRS